MKLWAKPSAAVAVSPPWASSHTLADDPPSIPLGIPPCSTGTPWDAPSTSSDGYPVRRGLSFRRSSDIGRAIRRRAGVWVSIAKWVWVSARATPS